MDARTLRVKRIVADNFVLILSVCLLLVLLGGYLTYTTHVEPGVETEQFEESSWSSTAELTHGATVTIDNPLFAEGSVLRERPAYLTEIMPLVNGTLEYTYQATDGGDLDVSVEQTGILRSVGEQDDEQFEYWQVEEELATTSAEGVSPGEPVEVPFSFNVSERVLTAEAIEEGVGGTPGSTELLVVSEISISGVRNGQEVAETYVYETTIAADESTYRFAGTGPHEESGEQLGEREMEASYGPLRSSAGPLLIVLGLIGGLGVAVGRYQGELAVSQAEREWLAYRTAYNEFEEWISTGHIADDALPSSRVTLDSLDGLVDVAIDSNRRVVHDRQRDSQLVIVDDTVYTYDPPAAPASLSQTDTSPLEPPGETTQSPPEETTQSSSGEPSQSPPTGPSQSPPGEPSQSPAPADETADWMDSTDGSTAENDEST